MNVKQKRIQNRVEVVISAGTLAWEMVLVYLNLRIPLPLVGLGEWNKGNNRRKRSGFLRNGTRTECKGAIEPCAEENNAGSWS